ncbi:MAG: hypothetical protein E7601_00695 [Ruminococcaceae bacterium]|nr:hypothetical protein [Oscillospiraceae bacterium]MBO4972652.1 hypothetical protein [Clostridia bacterium]MBQ1259281.1 hypothetical protein [Clostridia bacterium]
MITALKIFGIFEQFEPMNFITNFATVGAGMLGIFIVIGIIILSIVLLNSLTKKRPKKEKKNK